MAFYNIHSYTWFPTIYIEIFVQFIHLGGFKLFFKFGQHVGEMTMFRQLLMVVVEENRSNKITDN